MKKRIKINPFGLLKITDSVLKNVEENIDYDTPPEFSIKKFAKGIKNGKSSHFIGISPEKKELFSFIPIVEDDQFFVSFFPDPIQLYYSLAFSNYQFSVEARDSIVIQKNQKAKSPFNLINGYLYNWHLQYKISTIIFLHSTIEAFVNYIMPDDFIFIHEIKGAASDKFHRTIKEYNKEQTEKYIQFKDKIGLVVPQITGIDFQKQYQGIYDDILTISKIRNDIIHLRTTSLEKNKRHFESVFEKLINIELHPYVNSVKDFLNIIKPNFIVIEDILDSKEDEFYFEFQHYSAFSMDISVFLKILSVPTKVVILKIPKSEEDKFQIYLNWIMQNLDQMAEQQLINFSKINQEFEDRIEIKITKTDNVILKIKNSGSH
jgi:hypothetical protein